MSSWSWFFRYQTCPVTTVLWHGRDQFCGGACLLVGAISKTKATVPRQYLCYIFNTIADFIFSICFLYWMMIHFFHVDSNSVPAVCTFLLLSVIWLKVLFISCAQAPPKSSYVSNPKCSEILALYHECSFGQVVQVHCLNVFEDCHFAGGHLFNLFFVQLNCVVKERDCGAECNRLTHSGWGLPVPARTSFWKKQRCCFLVALMLSKNVRHSR